MVQVVSTLLLGSIAAASACTQPGPAAGALQFHSVETKLISSSPLAAGRFGQGIANLGDLDNDGVTDIAVSAYTESEGGVDQLGAVYVYLMNGDNTVKEQKRIGGAIINGVAEKDMFGSSMAGVGDVNGDGLGDMVVSTSSNGDALFVLCMDSDGSVKSQVKLDDTNLPWLIPSSKQGLNGIATMGDLDGDDVPDLAVGAYLENGKRGELHLVFLNSGGTFKSTVEINVAQLGLDSNDRFAYRLASLGDMDGDNVPELAVGAPRDDDGGSDRGAVYILFLSDSSGSWGIASYTKISSSTGMTGALDNGDFFGVGMTAGGDMDGDDIVDLVVGANRDDDGASNSGAVYVILLKADGSVKQRAKISQLNLGTAPLVGFDFFGQVVTLVSTRDEEDLGVTKLAVHASGDDDGGNAAGAVYIIDTSFDCVGCPTGYEDDGSHGCRDVDECDVNQDGCDLNHFCTNTVGSFQCVQCPTGYVASGDGTTCGDAILPDENFSYDTLPVYFHSAIGSGLWTTAQAEAIARYPLATFEKNQGFGGNPTGFTEVNGPAACQQINTVSQGTTTSLYYMNSVIDWQFYSLTQQMTANPDWRLKDENGVDMTLFAPVNPRWLFNVSVPEMREAWITDILDAIDAGCGGVFIDRGNNMGQFAGWTMSNAQSEQFQEAHMATLDELDKRLALKKAFAVTNNNAIPTQHRVMMMIEDFAGTENCIQRLQEVVSRGLGVQVHAGNYPSGGVNQCVNGDINAMAVFLIGMGDHSYYHCTPNVWHSNNQWPAVSDWWLDWLPEYDHPIGTPLADGVKGVDGVWRRSFSLGTTAEFDPSTGIGTITWGNNPSVPQVGESSSAILGLYTGCRWQTME